MKIEELREREKKFLPYADPELRSFYMDMIEYYDKVICSLLKVRFKDTRIEDVLIATKNFFIKISEMAVMVFELCAKKPDDRDRKNGKVVILYNNFYRKKDNALTKHKKLGKSLSNILIPKGNENEERIKRIMFKFYVNMLYPSLRVIYSSEQTIKRILGKRETTIKRICGERIFGD